MDLAEKYGVMQAPTLVVEDAAGARKYVGVEQIRDYAEGLTAPSVAVS